MTPRSTVSTRRLKLISEGNASLGVLSVHLDGEVCRVGCEFCYLGQRKGEVAPVEGVSALLDRALQSLTYEEVAVAVSEPAEKARPALETIRRAAGQRRLSVTTTMQIARAHAALLDGVDRVNLSVDPRKGRVSPAAIARLGRRLRAAGSEVVLIVSLTTPEFATRLIEGDLLRTLVDLPDVDKVALNALKPPPPWCGRAFWMRTLARLGPLLERTLDRRLFLDCWVAARLLHLGGCPARADLTPTVGGLAFRGCVYQPAADFVSGDAQALAQRLRGFVAPAECPFPIPG
jgi:hypothetical protein